MRFGLSAICLSAVFVGCGPLDDDVTASQRAELTVSIVAPGPVYAMAKQGSYVWYTSTGQHTALPECTRVLRLTRYSPGTGATSTHSFGCLTRPIGLGADSTYLYFAVGESQVGSTTEAYAVLRFEPATGVLTQLTALANRPNMFKAFNSMMYISDTTGVWTRPLVPGPSFVLSTSPVWDITTDGTDLFASDNAAIYRLKIHEAPVKLATQSATALIAVGDRLYFGAAGPARIGSIPKTGGAPAILYTTTTPFRRVDALTCDGASLAWTEVDQALHNGALYRMPKVGGPTTALVSGMYAPSSVLPLSSKSPLTVGNPVLLVGDYSGVRRVDDEMVLSQ